MRGQSSHGSAGLHGMKDMSQHDEWSRSGRRSDLKFNGRRIASRDAGNDSDRQATRGSSSGAGRPHQQRSREMQRTDEEREKERERVGGGERESSQSAALALGFRREILSSFWSSAQELEQEKMIRTRNDERCTELLNSRHSSDATPRETRHSLDPLARSLRLLP